MATHRIAKSQTRPKCHSRGAVVKDSPANEDSSSVPRSRRSSGVENGTPFQYSCLENSMDRGAWWATVHEATE